jgi:hypothetical protein
VSVPRWTHPEQAAEGGNMSTRPVNMWASLLFVALVRDLMRAAAFCVSLDYGRRRLARLWAASFLVSTLVAAYSFWRLV